MKNNVLNNNTTIISGGVDDPDSILIQNFNEDIYNSPSILKAVQIIMDFDLGQLSTNSIDSNSKYGVSNNWKIHKNELDENGIPKRIEMFAYYPISVLTDFIAYIRKNYNFNLNNIKSPSIFHVALALDKNKIYTSDWNEYNGTGTGYIHELNEVILHRNNTILLRVYRLVKPNENNLFKVEFTYQQSGKKKITKSAYALNKFKILLELVRKLELAFKPVLNSNDFTTKPLTIEEFENKVQEAIENKQPPKLFNNKQTKLFK